MSEEGGACQILQADGHDFGVAVDVDLAEELEAVRRRQIGLAFGWGFDELDLGAKRVVELVRAEAAGEDWAGDELLGLRLVGIVVVDVGCEPDDVLDVGARMSSDGDQAVSTARKLGRIPSSESTPDGFMT